jgi:hypothetical protein
VLGTGQSVAVTLTLARPDSFDQTLTIDPGGLAVTVTYTPPTQTGGPPASILRYRGYVWPRRASLVTTPGGGTRRRPRGAGRR